MLKLVKQDASKLDRLAFTKYPVDFDTAILLAILGVRVGEENGQLEHDNNTGEIVFSKRNPGSASVGLNNIFRKIGTLKHVLVKQKMMYTEASYVVLKRSETTRGLDSSIEFLERTLNTLKRIKESDTYTPKRTI